MFAFQAWPKTPRFTQEEIVITEKLDGTNAQINITEVPSDADIDGEVGAEFIIARRELPNGNFQVLQAGSRNRWVTPEDDNFGFAKWCVENQQQLFETFNHGRIYGEWFGKGIQRGYGLEEKRFALFNTKFPFERAQLVPQMTVVPVLYKGPFSHQEINNQIDYLSLSGSVAVPGFMNPEGICIYFRLTDKIYKIPI